MGIRLMMGKLASGRKCSSPVDLNLRCPLDCEKSDVDVAHDCEKFDESFLSHKYERSDVDKVRCGWVRCGWAH